VASGGSVAFSAVPNAGYAMGVWSLDGTTVQTGGRTYTLSNITANHTVAVTFIVFTPKVTPSAGANGTISPSAAQTVTYDTSLTFTATPATGYTVAGWYLDGAVVQSGGTTYTLSNIIASHTVSVTFNILTYTVTPSVGANGTLTPNTAKTVTYGSSLAFSAVPNAGYAMGVWSLDGTTVQTGGRSYTLSNITANHTVAVTFIVFTPTLTPTAGANGTISPSTAEQVTYNSSATFTATPNTGYTVNTWSLDGTVVQTGGTTYTLSNIIASHTVSVTFH
jgi:methyl coenzyme M reductase beta subunit